LHDPAKVRQAYEAARSCDQEGADRVLAQAESESSQEKKEQVAGVRRYLTSNRDGLADWHTGSQKEEGARGLGAKDMFKTPASPRWSRS